MRRVRTASGAVAVQVVVKEHGEVVEVDHVGSAHTDAELALLLTAATDRLHPGQEVLDLGPLPQPRVRLADVADWSDAGRDQIGAVAAGGEVEIAGKRQVDGCGRVVRTSALTPALTLWSVLEQAWTALGFDVVSDDAFRAVVLARMIEPVSKADTVRVLDEIGVAGPSLRTIFRALGRCEKRDYRGLLAWACLQHSTRSGPLSLICYDVTTLHFEIENEDELRKVGMSKQRRGRPTSPGWAAGRPVRLSPRGVLLRREHRKATPPRRRPCYRS